MNEPCIIIQGKSDHVDEIRDNWKNNNVIFSTWIGEETKYTKNDLVIFNDPPLNGGPQHLYFQQKSSLNGLLKAKEMGFKKAIKIRSDMIIKNVEGFLSVFDKQLNFFYWHDHDGGYLVDYFMGGDVDKMIDLWEIDKSLNYRFPEQAITKSFIDKSLYKNTFKFFGNSINKMNDIYWIKYNKYLSNYINDNSFKMKIWGLETLEDLAAFFSK